MASKNYRAAPGAVAILGLLAAAASGDAQSPAAPHAALGTSSRQHPCHAEVTTDGLNAKECPLASLHFHVSVPGCRNSRGTFVYQYLRVDPERKQTVQGTAGWIAHSEESDMTARVPASCEEEIDAAEVQRVTLCICDKD